MPDRCSGFLTIISETAGPKPASPAERLRALHELGRTCYVVSGGLADAVMGFAEWLGIPRQRVHAVGVSLPHSFASKVGRSA